MSQETVTEDTTPLSGGLEYATMETTLPFDKTQNITLLDHFNYNPPMESNDCWGYESPAGIKYALVGYFDKLSIFRIVNNKLILISEIGHGGSIWSDMKVYENYCYCVNETGGGIQVISLEEIDSWVYPHSATVNEINEVTINGVTRKTPTAHNAYVDEINGILYVLGAKEPKPSKKNKPQEMNLPSFALHFADSQTRSSAHIETTNTSSQGPQATTKHLHDENPRGYNYMFALNSSIISGASAGHPVFMNDSSIYFHDLVTYTYNNGSKIYAFASGEEKGVYVIDVTDPLHWDYKHILNDYKQYTEVDGWEIDGYMHQIWYSSDGRYIFANDELLTKNTIIIYDLKPFLDDENVPPTLMRFNIDGTVNNGFGGNLWSNGQTTNNHNLYIHHIDGKDYIFHSCYKSGLRIHEINRDATTGDMLRVREVGYFDSFNESNGAGFMGQWSNYYWNDNERLIVVSDIKHGTFLLKWDGTSANDPVNRLDSNNLPVYLQKYDVDILDDKNESVGKLLYNSVGALPSNKKEKRVCQLNLTAYLKPHVGTYKIVYDFSKVEYIQKKQIRFENILSGTFNICGQVLDVSRSMGFDYFYSDVNSTLILKVDTSKWNFRLKKEGLFSYQLNLEIL